MSVGFAVSLMWRFFSALCRALPTALAVLRNSLYRRLPLGVPASFLPTSACPSLAFSVLLLRRLACRWSLGSALCAGVLPLPLWLLFAWQCGGALRLPKPLGFVCCNVVPSCGSQPLWVLPGGCASGLRSLGHTLAAKFVQSRLPFVVLLLLWVELPWGLCCGVLSPWPLVAPSPSVVSRLGFFLWRLFRLGLEGCGPVLDPPFFWEGLSFPCPCCFRLAVPTVLLSRFLEFLELFAGVSFLSLPVCTDSSGWLMDSPWLSTLHCLAAGGVTLFFCQRPVGLP